MSLITPIAAQASDIINLEEIDSYMSGQTKSSRIDSNTFINEVNEDIATLQIHDNGLEVAQNEFEASGFSDTTVMSGKVIFDLGAVDGATISNTTTRFAVPTVAAGDAIEAATLDLINAAGAPEVGGANGDGVVAAGDATADHIPVTEYVVTTTAPSEAVTFSYDFSMDLATSFTGEDSLDIALIGGNAAGTPVDAFMGGDGTADIVVLDGISYTFPLGGATVIVGDGVGVDDLNTGACAYSAFTDLLGDCGANNVGGSGDSGFAVAYDFGNGFTMAGGLSGGPGNAGLFTEEDASTIGSEAAYTADNYGVAVAFTDDETVTYWTINAMITPEGFPSISVGYETDDGDADAMFAGLTFDEVGAGSVSVGIASTATDTADNYQYELSYSYPINDGMTITPGVFVAETAGEDDTGFVVKTSFEF